MSDTRKEVFKNIHERCFQFGSCNYKETGCSDCPINVILVKAETLLDKQEQGLLIELPCKVGDTLYYIYGKEIVEVKVLRIEIIYTEIHIVTGYNSLGKIGKTLFFTRSEAEEALAKMGGK